jgi:hypothetical protein
LATAQIRAMDSADFRVLQSQQIAAVIDLVVDDNLREALRILRLEGHFFTAPRGWVNEKQLFADRRKVGPH